MLNVEMDMSELRTARASVTPDGGAKLVEDVMSSVLQDSSRMKRAVNVNVLLTLPPLRAVEE